MVYNTTQQPSLFIKNFSGKNTGASCHFLLQGVFPTPGIQRASPMSPALAGAPPGKPIQHYSSHLNIEINKNKGCLRRVAITALCKIKKQKRKAVHEPIKNASGDGGLVTPNKQVW